MLFFGAEVKHRKVPESNCIGFSLGDDKSRVDCGVVDMCWYS